MFSWTTLTILCGALSYVIAGPVLCTFSDLDCLKNIFNDDYPKLVEGDPKLDMENLDPMHHDKINGNWSMLKYKITNSTVTGFKDCKIEDFKVNLQSHMMQSELVCPKLTMNGKYEIHGRLISLPIEGSGDFIIYANKYIFTVTTETRIESGKDGKNYFSIKSFKFAAEPLESVKFDFKNLFNGQKESGDAAVNFINDNWYEVAKELQDPVFKAIIKKIIKNANKYYKKKPLDEFISL